MAEKDRRSLLETGKEAGKSVAGTLGSVAGTLSEKGKQAASATKQQVTSRAESLLDAAGEDEPDLTDQEEARLDRARLEAEKEARREAQQEYREEFRENIFDEAYDAELQRLRRDRGEPEQVARKRATETVSKPDRSTQPRGKDPTDRRRTAGRSSLSMLGFSQPQPARREPREQPAEPAPEPEPRRPAGAGMGLFGVPQGGGTQPRAEQTDVTAIFGGGGFQQQERDDGERRDPLFGMQY